MQSQSITQQTFIKNALFTAIKQGNLDKVKLLIQNSSLTCEDANELTPILFAARIAYKRRDTWEIIKFLLKKAESIQNRKDKRDKMHLGRVLLHCVDSAALWPDERDDLAIRLIKLGANVKHILSNDHKTALHLAVEKGYSNIVKALLEAGADVNAKSKSNEKTALHLAAENNRVNILDMLLKAGANINATTRDGQVPLSFAIRGPLILRTECARALIEFEAEQNIEFLVLALNFLFPHHDNKLTTLPTEIRFRILWNLPVANSFRAILAKNQDEENAPLFFNTIQKTIILIKAQCAIEAYEKIRYITVPVETPVPHFVRSPQSVAFFKEVKNTLADDQKNKDEKVTAINNARNAFSKNPPSASCNAMQIVKRFHL